MDIDKKLSEIWHKYQFSELPKTILERGYNYSINENSRDILVTGINPSYRRGEINGNCCYDFNLILQNSKYDTYWTSLKKMLFDENINLLNRTAYLDIFYYREKKQLILTKEILPSAVGLSFISDQLNLTQKIIENIIKPKVIIVKNKESGVYWGKLANKGIFWMGYDLEFLEKTIYGELYKIKGIIETANRICPEIINTNLENSLILFSVHINHFTPKEKRPTSIFINELLQRVE